VDCFSINKLLSRKGNGGGRLSPGDGILRYSLPVSWREEASARNDSKQRIHLDYARRRAETASAGH
jgi:hypothetical protein